MESDVLCPALPETQLANPPFPDELSHLHSDMEQKPEIAAYRHKRAVSLMLIE